ncbi:bifunctional 2-polyprenyl-6-hydroxyphenol methylase/3-demethylubiquinol 3-O-methyltransferase UbiG [Streptomyces sp. UNOB3_S3]|uniref:class I SAM-dependent methyltransferase n=1 Tax=Streptomyces sp. UNOB3_S3 TaxID=2871682 RepID=UPI001E596DC1|nr:class I SAM-dependent methyltransferase [Streptomyces sp. UNOB3_S3]MCC3773384.1 class I SAM-dependent methyltransferase [Streptomyces sp. UNOB3_S3]
MAASFGVDAERYDRTRPRYPQAMVERIAAESPGPDVPDVLDVGCGTGIVARQFQAAGCAVLGVEPDARMADVARRLGAAVDVATFEDWDPAGREFDAVVAGQTWHWIDPVAGAAKAAHVLRPGGRLALFWNVPELPPAVAEAIAEAARRAVPDAPFDLRQGAQSAGGGYQPILDRATDAIRDTGAFGDAERWRFAWEWSYTRDAWLDVMPTQGAFTRLPQDKLAEVLEATGAAIDAMGGGFTMRYTTVAVVTARAGAGPRPEGGVRRG